MTNLLENVYIDGLGVAVGDRIRLVNMPSDPCPVEPGATGTVEAIHDLRGIRHGVQLSIKWDNGRALMVVIPPDVIEIEDGERQCGWCGESFNLADGGEDFDPEAGGPVCRACEPED